MVAKTEMMKAVASEVKCVAKSAIMHSTGARDHELVDVHTLKPAEDAANDRAKPDDQWHDYVRGVVYGGLDGILTMFALMASAVGSDVSIRGLMAMGIANVLADGMSMGFGGYVSSLSEIEQNRAVRERVGNMHDDDVAGGLQSLYREKGMSDADAANLVKIFANYPILMKERYCADLEGVLPAEEDGCAVTEGKVTFQSFLLFGSLPLVPIAFALAMPESDTEARLIQAVGCSILFTVLTLAALGYTKAGLAGQSKWSQMCLMVANGVVCAGVSFLVSVGADEALQVRMLMMMCMIVSASDESAEGRRRIEASAGVHVRPSCTSLLHGSMTNDLVSEAARDD